jgi:pyruvate kinase
MTTLTPAELFREIEALRAAVRDEAAAILAGWSGARLPARALPAAHNLACYLALRRHDISDLQEALAAFGLSSLGRLEGHVMASLESVCATLGRLVGAPRPGRWRPGRIAVSGAALRQAQRRFFGPDRIGARARIMVTLPSEAAKDRALVRSLIEAGMTCARINCAHDDAQAWRAMAALVREESAPGGCTVLMDIAGPKLRLASVHAAEPVRLRRGDTVVLVRDLSRADSADPVIATLSHPAVVDSLSPGAEVWINDGRIGLAVTAAAPGRAVLIVVHARAKGERLRPGKGVNVPELGLALSPLTEKDRADLDVVAEIADSVGYSFVQRPEDVALLSGELALRRPGRPPLPMVLKIETQLAVRNLPRLIVTALARGPVAVMIARGDLAVELGFARMSEIQEEILWIAEAARVPVVWATQVLDSLVREGLPSRAEATDAAMAQRAECVMLNKGPHLAAGVRFLADVLRRMDRHQRKKTARFGALQSWPPEELTLTSAEASQNGERFQRTGRRATGGEGVSVTARCGP